MYIEKCLCNENICMLTNVYQGWVSGTVIRLCLCGLCGGRPDTAAARGRRVLRRPTRVAAGVSDGRCYGRRLRAISFPSIFSLSASLLYHGHYFNKWTQITWCAFVELNRKKGSCMSCTDASEWVISAVLEALLWVVRWRGAWLESCSNGRAQ